MRLFTLFTGCMLALAATLYSKPIKILSFDGGGVRGAASLKALQMLQEKTHFKIHDDFDIFAGTSTGSIIAISLAGGLDPNLLLKDYIDMSGRVFGDPSHLSLFKAKYDPEQLRACFLENIKHYGFDETTPLNHLPKKVVIVTVNLDDKETGRWKMQVRENITREGGQFPILEALMESTAAPTFFPSEQGHIDGGIAMNDPALAALMTAYNNTENLQDFRILSFGTGFLKESIKGDESWGESQWVFNATDSNMGSVPIVSLLMDVGEQIPAQVCSKLLGSHYARFNFPIKPQYTIDDFTQIPSLIKYTEDYVKAHPKEWAQLCNWVNENVQR